MDETIRGWREDCWDWWATVSAFAPLHLAPLFLGLYGGGEGIYTALGVLGASSRRPLRLRCASPAPLQILASCG